MTTKKKCSVCGKRFEAKRSDTMYCSTQCKQHAHYRRVSTQKVESHQEIFFLDEYNEVEAVYREMELVTYCFIRRNLNTDATVPEILQYMKSVWDYSDMWETYFESKPFRTFKERFLNGEIKVFTRRFQVDRCQDRNFEP